MFQAMSIVVRRIESLIDGVGKLTLYVALAMIGLVATNVLLRYAFSFGSVWAQELEWHLLAPLVLAGMTYALQKGEHVRVDVFYAHYSPRTQAAVEAAIDECDRFYPAFQFVLWGDKSPAEALASALVDAAGEA